MTKPMTEERLQELMDYFFGNSVWKNRHVKQTNALLEMEAEIRRCWKVIGVYQREMMKKSIVDNPNMKS